MKRFSCRIVKKRNNKISFHPIKLIMETASFSSFQLFYMKLKCLKFEQDPLKLNLNIKDFMVQNIICVS